MMRRNYVTNTRHTTETKKKKRERTSPSFHRKGKLQSDTLKIPGKSVFLSSIFSLLPLLQKKAKYLHPDHFVETRNPTPCMLPHKKHWLSKAATTIARRAETEDDPTAGGAPRPTLHHLQKSVLCFSYRVLDAVPLHHFRHIGLGQRK